MVHSFGRLRRRDRRPWAGLALATAALVWWAGARTEAQSSGRRVEIVATAGCLREQPAGTWMLVNATEPVKSSANAPQKNELPQASAAGKQQFQLIGVGEFDLPSLKNQLVYVKGLHIVATPTSRLNVTSVTAIAPTCPGGPAGAAR